MIEHAQGLQALLGPTVNAYKRILPDSLAPTHANWGHDNRTAFCRVPNERGSRTRVEIRTGDGSACPHLITAALLLAGLDGIERELAPPEPVVGDAYRMDDAHAGTRLPADLGAALDALEADTWLVEQLGEELVSTFVAMKRFEVERFNEAVGDLDPEVVTEWEVQEYAVPSLSVRAARPRRGRRRAALGAARTETSIVLDDGTEIAEADALYLAPAEPTKIFAVHLTYRSRVEEYAARTPPEPSYFVKPPTTLNGHRRPIRMAKGARFLNYEGELAVVVGRRMKGVPIDDALSYVARLRVRERRRDARLPPRRPRGDAAREGTGRVPPARPGARPGRGVRPDRLHAAHLPQRRTSCRRRPRATCMFGVAYQLADLCRVITLEPGDVLLTGTPANSRPMKPGDLVEVEIAGLGRLANTSRSGTSTSPGRASSSRCPPRPSTSRSRSRRTRPSGWSRKAAARERERHVSGLRSARERERRRLIRLGRIDHVGLRVADLDEAAARWCVQLGLVERSREGGTRSSRATTSRTASSSSPEASPGTTTSPSSCTTTCSLDDARAHLDALGVASDEREGSICVADPDGRAIQLLPIGAPATRGRPLAAARAALVDGARRRPAEARPRQLPHGRHPRERGVLHGRARDAALRLARRRPASGSTSTPSTT